MNNCFTKTNILDGIEVLSVEANRFKTVELSVSFSMPLTRESASVNAIIPRLLSHSCKKYNTLVSLNKQLATLYGAELLGIVSKVGDNQLLKIGISCLDDKFSLDNSSISMNCAKLLKELVFNPNLDENGFFFEEDIEREKRLLIESLESEMNEKRIYAVHRLEEEMFSNEAYGINRYGTKNDIEAITKESATKAYQNILKTAKILVTSVGTVSSDEIKDFCVDAFSNIKRDYKNPVKTTIKPNVDKVKTVEERLNIKQGKLVLGFRVDMNPNDEKTAEMRSTADVFGGGPYSRLFANVREKMSLCYYCSARYIRQIGAIIVQCGCEEENMDKAVDEILNQLNYVINDDITEEFNSSKISIADSINSLLDAPESIESWYVSQMIDDVVKSPSESVAENNKVTINEVKECAKKIKLDTIYKLMGVNE